MAKEKINVDSYQDLAFDGAWKGRGRALWAIGALGLMTGAAIGLLAPVLPLLTGVTVGLAAVAKTVAIFSAIGLTAGVALGATIGNVSGGIAAVAKEQEQRVKQATKEHSVDMDMNVHNEQDSPPVKKTFARKLKDGFETYVNPRVGLVFTLLGAIGGLALGGAYLSGASEFALPAMGLVLGTAAHSASAVLAYSVGVTASFGAIFGFNYPKMSTDMTHYVGDIMSGEKLGRTWGPEPEKAPEQKIARTQEPEMKPERLAARERPFATYQDLIAAQQAAAEQSSPTPKR